MNRAYISLGSNINPAENLRRAVVQLGEYGVVERVSRVWETEPVGLNDQPRFLNAAVLLNTELDARSLKKQALDAVERALGRIRNPGCADAPRPIDVDLVLFNEDVLKIEHRRIPDPEILDRGYVGIPVAELDPGYRHPETGDSLAVIAARFDPDSIGMRCCVGMSIV